MKITNQRLTWWENIMSKIGKGNPFPSDVPTISLAASTASISENNTLNVTINRTASPYTSTCRVYTIAGSADATDYTNQNGTLITFAPGDTSKVLGIPIINTGVIEPDETFTVQISNPNNAIIGANKMLVTIIGTAAPPAVVSSVSSPSVVVGGLLSFNIVLSNPSLGQVFPFGVAGTATGVRYTIPLTFSNGVTISGTNLNIPVGVTTFTASTLTKNDNVVHPTETVILTVGGITGTGSIIDNNAAPSLPVLTEIVIFEAPYGKLSSAQQTAIAGGGGFPAFVVSRNSTSSPSYSVFECDTIGGIYTRTLASQPYAQSAVVQGAVTLDHRTLTLDTISEFPTTIAANSYGVLADTTGQYEHLQINNVSTVSLLGDTNRLTTGLNLAIYDSQLIAVAETSLARLYNVPTLPIINTIIADGVSKFYKIAPEGSSGTPIALAGITPIQLTCNSIARKPYPSRYNTIGTTTFAGGDNRLFITERIGFSPDLLFNSGKSSRLDEVTPSDYFNPASILEAGTTINIDVMDAQGTTLIRTLTCDASGNATYSAANRATDIARTLTRYVTYTNRGGIKSSGFAWNIECDVANENLVTSVTNVKFSTTLVKSTVALTAAAAAPAGTGQETGIAFIQVSGTAFANIDIANIVVNTGGAEIIERDVAKGEFYIQFPRSTASVELGLPYTGSVGLTIIVSAGSKDLGIGNAGYIFTGTSTVTI